MSLNNKKKSTFYSSFTNLNHLNDPNPKQQQQTYTDSNNNNLTLNHKNTFSSVLSDDSYVFEDQASEDCVYQITYKKVYTTTKPRHDQTDPSRLLTPSFCSYLNHDESKQADGLVYSRVKIKQLKYASLAKFIEHLTNEETGEIDSNLVQTFLTTYRTFSDTKTVLKQIRLRYESILPASLEMTEDVRLEHLKSFRLILKMWLENYSEDFNEPTEYPNLNELNRFAHSHLTDSDLIPIIRKHFDKFESLDSKPPKSPIVPACSSSNKKLNMSDNLTIKSASNSTHRRSYSNLGKSATNLNHSQSRSQTNLAEKDPKSIHGLFGLFTNNNNSSSGALSRKSSSLFIDENFNIDLEDKFMGLNSEYIAEQLTYLDKCLFQQVCAHQCLASVWSTRYQKTAKQAQNQLTTSSSSNSSSFQNFSTTPMLSDKFATIRAFIDQFNCVSFIVQATILDNVELRPVDRARIIKKWIEVAQACRRYKNFSSLNAIVQGLNTQCVSRLEKTWNEVPSELKLMFDGLTEMFSQDQNQKIFRDILMKDLGEYRTLFNSADSNNNSLNTSNLNLNRLSENMEGTAKYANINSGINATLSRKMKEKMIKQQNKKHFREPIGTVPFLGTFLKDLEYINAQNPKNEKGLINVQQKRKEFEVIAQIKLLQQASLLYNMKSDVNFEKWLHSQPVYSEAQYYEFSYMIEQKFDREATANNRKTKLNISQGSRSESIESLNIFNLISNKTPSLILKKNKTHSRNSSMASSDLVDSSNLNLKPFDSPQSNSTHNDNNSTNTSNSLDGFSTSVPKYGKSISQSSNSNSNTNSSSSSEIRVKVNIESFGDSNNSVILYKKMSITDKYRTKDVKRLILEKFFLSPDTFDKYILVQILDQNNNDFNQVYQQQGQSSSELVINENCNVFYAAKNVPDMQFVLRSKASSNLSTNTNTYSKSVISNGLSQSNGTNLNVNLIKNGNSNNRSTSLNRNGLPPQAPNYQTNKIKNQNSSNGSGDMVKFFKKILS